MVRARVEIFYPVKYPNPDAGLAGTGVPREWRLELTRVSL
jgi:hypothetical protein